MLHTIHYSLFPQPLPYQFILNIPQQILGSLYLPPLPLKPISIPTPHSLPQPPLYPSSPNPPLHLLPQLLYRPPSPQPIHILLLTRRVLMAVHYGALLVISDTRTLVGPTSIDAVAESTGIDFQGVSLETLQ